MPIVIGAGTTTRCRCRSRPAKASPAPSFTDSPNKVIQANLASLPEPLLRKPTDMITVDLGAFAEAYDNAELRGAPRRQPAREAGRGEQHERRSEEVEVGGQPQPHELSDHAARGLAQTGSVPMQRGESAAREQQQREAADAHRGVGARPPFLVVAMSENSETDARNLAMRVGCDAFARSSDCLRSSSVSL